MGNRNNILELIGEMAKAKVILEEIKEVNALGRVNRIVRSERVGELIETVKKIADLSNRIE